MAAGTMKAVSETQRRRYCGASGRARHATAHGGPRAAIPKTHNSINIGDYEHGTVFRLRRPSDDDAPQARFDQVDALDARVRAAPTLNERRELARELFMMLADVDSAMRAGPVKLCT